MDRKKYLRMIKHGLEQFPVVALLGPRQVGKTTLAQEYIRSIKATKTTFFDLEDPESLAHLSEAKLALAPLEGLVVLDEVQLKKDLFPVLRVLSDRRPIKTRFLLLGSASSELVGHASESLAGRVQFIEIYPFSTAYEENLNLDRLWVRGGFPRAYLAKTDADCFGWCEQFIRTFLERDLSKLGFNFPSETMRRFWMMFTHYHGQVLNASELGRSLDLSDTTVKRYIDALVGTFMIRRLSPWHENISKRQVKQPKIYFRDSGIFHRLLGIKKGEELNISPKLGASWEGFAVEQIITRHQADLHEAYFWGVHEQMELDLLIVKDGKRFGYEVKHTAEPTVPKNAEEIIRILKLDSITVVHRGKRTFKLHKDVLAASLEETLRR